MTPAAMALLIDANNKFNNPDSPKSAEPANSGLSAFANMKQR